MRLSSLMFPTNSSVLTNRQFACIAGFWMVMLLPVPSCRAYLRDHSPTQVVIGSILGCLEGIAWFHFVRVLAYRYRRSLGRRWPANAKWFLLQHNYRIPKHELLMLCVGKSPKIALEEDTALNASGWSDSTRSERRQLAEYRVETTSDGLQYLTSDTQKLCLPRNRKWRLVVHKGSSSVMLCDGVQVLWAAEALQQESSLGLEGTPKRPLPPRLSLELDDVTGVVPHQEEKPVAKPPASPGAVEGGLITEPPVCTADRSVMHER